MDISGLLRGCSNLEASQDNCSDSSVLTEDEFTVRGRTFTVAYLYSADLAGRDLYLRLDGLTGAQAKSALTGLTLHADGNSFAISDAVVPNLTIGFLRWPWPTTTTSPDWTDGQTVSLRLTAPLPKRAVTEVTCDDATAYGTRCWVPTTGA